LLLKLLLTTEPLSIQVHPDDAFAHSIRLANGKTEAWYILSVIPGATFRLFDYGRERQLHIENAVAVATAGPQEIQSSLERLSTARTAPTVNSHFALEDKSACPDGTFSRADFRAVARQLELRPRLISIPFAASRQDQAPRVCIGLWRNVFGPIRRISKAMDDVDKAAL